MEGETDEEKKEKVLTAESSQVDDTEQRYEDDWFADEVPRKRPYDESEWEAEEDWDWEKEAKEKVLLDEDEPSMEPRRRTIYELAAYESTGPSKRDLLRLSVVELDIRPPKIRYSVSMGMPGIARIDLSPLTQKIVGCVIGEDVTTEYPWVHVRKEIIEDNIYLHSESSEFLPMKDEIYAYPDSKMLIGYAPSIYETGQFYICLSEEGRDSVHRYIKSQRMEHESRVRNAVYKSPRWWIDLGSGAEVDITVVKNTRPLFEIEVTSTADILNMPLNLTDRKADDQRDGYVELLPYRQTYENIWRKLISRPIQVIPGTRNNEAQTGPTISANSWFQYLYEYKMIDLSTYTEDKMDALKDFLRRNTDEMCDQVLMNTMWDIYESDLAALVLNEKDTQPPVPLKYTEHQNYYDAKITKNKLINDLSWHPFWTGIAAITYTKHTFNQYLSGPMTYDEVQLACNDDNKVLMWSFTDSLSPKLILECPREVTTVTVCPIDSSIVIGGCANGQVAIWHIPGKIEQVEAVVTQTEAQAKYTGIMKSLMVWMHETKIMSLISPVAMSSLKHSHKRGITKIIWMPSHFKVDKNGRIVFIPEDATLEDLSCQFITSSKDGTIAFWDLKWRPPEKEIQRTKRKKRRISTLVVSPFKILDRIFKPDYMLAIHYPEQDRPLMITMVNLYNPKFEKEQVEPFPVERDDVTIRKYYKPIIEKTDYIMKPEILIGSVEGDLGCVTWDGYEFATDASVNRETARWVWIKRIHDGPVTQAARSKSYYKVIATVGGKIFAVWRDDFGEPLIWKKSTLRYTACSWGIFRPTILIVMRVDGSIEIWDFIVKSQEPGFTQSVSGRIITGAYTHELPLEPQCIGFCDFTGSLRMFMAPRALLTYDMGDVEWLKKFIDRQVQRIKDFRIWQERWRQENPQEVEIMRHISHAELEMKRQEMAEKIRLEKAEIEEREIKPKMPRKPWQFLEETKAKWMAMEVKRMQRVILEQKGLRKDVLERQRAPVLKLQQEARRKKRKIREILNLQDEIFEQTIMFLFPEQYRELEEEPVLPPLPIAIDRRITIEEFIERETVLRDEDAFIDPEEEIIFNFIEVQTEALTKMRMTPFVHKFDWRKILAREKF